MNRRSGFSLVELLVVVAIIAILVSILFPIFARAKNSAHVANCISNMKQIASAIELYRSDNYGNLPLATNIYQAYYPNWNYFSALERYTKNKSVFCCSGKPISAIKDALEAGVWNSLVDDGKWRGTSYTPPAHTYKVGYYKRGPEFAEIGWSQPRSSDGAVSYGYGTRNLDTFDYIKYGALGPSKAVVMACVAGTANWMFDESDQRFQDFMVRGTHHDGTVVLFADMHAKYVGWKCVGGF